MVHRIRDRTLESAGSARIRVPVSAEASAVVGPVEVFAGAAAKIPVQVDC